MASNHVPSDQAPVQGHTIYTDPTYQNLFSTADRYVAPSWESQLHQQSGTPQNWHHGVYTQSPYNATNQPYASQPHGLRTASPYQYGQFSQPGSVPSYGQISNVDPSLGMDPSAIRQQQQQQQSPYPIPARNGTPQAHASTVTPQALQHTAASQVQRPAASPFQVHKPLPNQYMPQRPVQTFVQPVKEPVYELPGVSRKGGFFLRDQSELAKITNSNALNKFVMFGSDYFHLPTNRTALPTYNPRLSIKELKKAGKDSRKLKAQLQASKSQMRAIKSEKRSAASSADLKREVSDSASSDETSDDSSDYTSDEEEEESPLPASRPDDPHAAVRYDVIKSTWYPRASSPSSEKIRTSMREIWEVLSTIQKRWRADTKAVSEAEEQKKIGELPVLKSRVASQRDLLQSALAAALEFAHPDVLYQLGQVKVFLYLCYQFLANRFQNKDYNGELAAVILEVLTHCGTYTSEDLEEAKLMRAFSAMKKHVNDKHKTMIEKIIENAATNTKKAKTQSSTTEAQAQVKPAKRPAPDAATRTAVDGNPAKKPKAGEALANTVRKDGATPVGVKPVASAVQKKPGERPAAAPAPVKTRVSQVTNKPSGIFASLTAAAKKPTVPAGGSTKVGPPSKATTASVVKDKKPAPTSSKSTYSFLQTIASISKPVEQEVAPTKPEKQVLDETPDEKAKRLRKESRRHLRVKFRPDTSLVEIKYFEHEAQEDMGHEEHLRRDAGDLGGEGRMFKQHKELDMEEDDDDEDEAKPWPIASLIDFSRIDALARNQNYYPYGGGTKQPESPEKEANLHRESATLMIVYADAADIPFSPREPLEETVAPTQPTQFGSPPPEVLKRGPQSAPPVPEMDFSNLENIMRQFAVPAATPAPVHTPPIPVQAPMLPPPPAGAPPVDLASILSMLGQTNTQAAQPAPTTIPAPAPVSTPVQASMPMPGPPTFDINAIMAGLQASGAALPPPPPGFPPFPFPFAGLPQPQDTKAWQPQMQPQQEQDNNSGMRRQRDDGNVNNYNNNNNNGSNDRTQRKRPKFNHEKSNYKVLMCRFYSKGTCTKGEDCTYIHDNDM